MPAKKTNMERDIERIEKAGKQERPPHPRVARNKKAETVVPGDVIRVTPAGATNTPGGYLAVTSVWRKHSTGMVQIEGTRHGAKSFPKLVESFLFRPGDWVTTLHE